MPYSYSDFKKEIQEHFQTIFQSDENILDVGPGSGTYSQLVTFPIDCLEIFPPYIDMFKLHEKYRTVFTGDILLFDTTTYDYIIFGDVIEHLLIEQAQSLLQHLHEQGKRFLVAVPYRFPQQEEFGNIHETHHQDDLTPEIMLARYPMLQLLHGNTRYGYYVNY